MPHLDGRFDAAWRTRFERFARSHPEEHRVSGWSAEGLRRRVGCLARLIPGLALPGRARVLELGCGAGTLVRMLAGLGHAVVGLDYSLPTLARALEADPGGKGTYVAGEGYRLPIRSGSVDLLVCIGVLQAIADPERLLGEAARVLRPGGAAVVEALNPHEIPARVRALREAVARRPPRVRRDAPGQLEEWLDGAGLGSVARVPVYLAPRGAPAVGRVLDHPAAGWILARTPRLARATAHAFWVVARKRG